MQLVDDDLEVRHGVDGIVEVAGLWYARHVQFYLAGVLVEHALHLGATVGSNRAA